MATSLRHLEVGDRLLEQAEEELRRGDALQAAEKAWGAVAHCVKSLSQDRGWDHGTHRQILVNARDLIRQLSPHEELDYGRFMTVRALHVHFYEIDLEEDAVRRGIDAARALTGVLKSGAEAGGPPAPGR